jgi:glyoxylase-like metal-dependent hydrolase (beta-lactamase superfamily II)
MPIERIHKGIYQIRAPFDKTGTVFLYLLKGDRVALIDTGVSDSPRAVLQPALAEIGMSLADVEFVLNTHAHLDHSGGNQETKLFSTPRIHLHALDLPMAQSTEDQVEFHTAPLRVLEFPDEVVRERAERVRRLAGNPVGVDVLLSDGDTIDLGAGMTIRAIHCPGHTPGHVVYFWEAEGIAFTGDAVQCQGSRPGSYPLYFDAANYRRSVTKLQNADCQMLCLGHAFHGGTLINSPTRQGPEAKIFLRAAAEVADTIHGAVARVMQQRPQASKREVALAALSDLLYEIPQLRLRQTDMPVQAGPTLLSHIEAVLSGSYPS